MLDINKEILNALAREDRIMLATIIATSGSTPAAIHSKMLVTNRGTTSVGTVGGGCMEGEVILQANRLSTTGRAEILTFDLNDDDADGGMICGGGLDVLIEPVTKDDIPLVKQLQALRDDGVDCLLATLLTPEGSISWKQVIRMTDDVPKARPVSIPGSSKEFDDAVGRARKKHEIQLLELPSGRLIIEPFLGTPDCIIVGGGHVSKFVSDAAAMVGFRVTITDDREKYANPIRFPNAARTIISDFSEAFSTLTIKPTTYIVIVTRGHRYDEVVLEQAVKTPAKYIGMIGSKRKVLTTYEHLRERGVTDEMLSRVCAPIGLNIGAVTAEEIAISIVAEMIIVRRGKKNLLKHMSENH